MITLLLALCVNLLSIVLIVLHSFAGSLLRSNVSTNCLHFCLLCSFFILMISSFISCRAGVVECLDLRSSHALILSNISVGTDSVLRRCCPEGMWCDAALRMMARKKPSFAQLVLLLFATTRSVFKSVKVSVVEIAKRTT